MNIFSIIGMGMLLVLFVFGLIAFTIFLFVQGNWFCRILGTFLFVMYSLLFIGLLLEKIN